MIILRKFILLYLNFSNLCSYQNIHYKIIWETAMLYKTFSFRISILTIIATILTASCGVLKPSLKGAVISPPVPAADINLTDHNGQPFQLSKFRGKVALVFFGFSNCVDECPATMALIRQALDTVGNASKDVEVVMVSTDPARDTPASMKEFMGRFNPAFLGLLGTPEELQKAWQDYGVTVLDGGETHSSFTYVVDKKGSLRETFLPDTPSDDIAADVKVLLAEN
jgi:protein SCO1/2